MTKKEKAIELMNKFIPLCERELEKQCALIVVDEIIKELETLDAYCCADGLIEWWEEVKNEIEQL